MYDCLIVGAGPAGCTTAYHLARQGHSVLLLEAQPLPRMKPCSGALAPTVKQWIDVDLRPALDYSLRKIRYTWRLEEEVLGELTTQEPMGLVNRQVFDQFLLEQAVGAGAMVRDGCPVTAIAPQGDHWQVTTPQETVSGRYLVAADGATGPLAGWLGFKGGKVQAGGILAIDTGADPDPAFALNFEFGLAKNSCLWAFPRQGGYTLGSINFVGARGVDLEQILWDYAKGLGLPENLGKFSSHPVKLWNGNYALHGRRWLVVGEAGAIVDPLSGEGIRPGVYSGARASEAIHAALQGNDQALARYSTTLHQEWGSDGQWAQRIAAVFYRVPGIAYRVGIKRPTATERLGQLLAGEVRYSDIANRVLKRLSTGLLSGSKG